MMQDQRSTPTRWPLPHLSGPQADLLVGGLFAALVIGGLLAWLWLGSIVLGGMLGIGTLLLTYASFIEPRRLRVISQKVSFPLKNPLRIAVVADFHVGPFKGREWIDFVVHKISTLNADLTLIPGDFLFDPLHPLEPLEGLKNLHAPLGVFAVPGNHDAGNLSHFGRPVDMPDRTEDLEAFLAPLGIRMLRNRSTIVKHHDETFAIAGIDDLWSKSCNLDAAFADIPESTPTICLTHHPDTILEDQSKKADLIICGHTHGGQVCLPGGYPIAGVPAIVGRKYAHGLFAITQRTTLFVTRGCGESMMRMRFCCRPEIVLLECGC
jgi:uncharacterized protein